MREIYLDHNATTPLLSEALEAMLPFWKELFGNPSSIHEVGSKVKRSLREARRELAFLLAANDESEMVFTSGGTESNNTALRSALATQKGRKRIVTTTVEHSSILRVCRALQEEGAEVVYCPVKGDGTLDWEKLAENVTPECALVSVMMANNETGVLFPVEKIGNLAHERGALFHVDAVQAVGKIPISLGKSAIDFLSLSAHKLGGPKGVGALFVKKGVPFRPFCFGGSQERGRRAGTENVPGIVGLGEAARWHRRFQDSEIQRIQEVRNRFEEEILRRIPNAAVNGNRNSRLPNTSNLALEDVDTEALLILLDGEGIYASSGSACLSGSPEPSHVLKAMGQSDERARSSVRFSFGHTNTEEEISITVEVLQRLVTRLREIKWEEQHPHSVVG